MPRHQYSDSSTTVSTVNNSCRNNIISNSETHTLIFFFFTCLPLPFFLTHHLLHPNSGLHAGIYASARAIFSWLFFNSLCRVLLMQLHKVSRLSNSTLCWHNQIHPNAQHMEIDNNGPSKTFQHTDTYYIKCAQLFSLTEFFPLVWPIPALQ